MMSGMKKLAAVVVLASLALAGYAYSQQATRSAAYDKLKTGALTVSGALNCKNFETVACIDSANTQGWSGADAFAQLNSAVATLGAGGGKVLVAAGTFTGSTTVAITTNNVTLECLGSWRATGTQGSSILRWTGGASPQFTVAARNFTMKSCTLDNTGTATYGIQLGTAVAAAGHILLDDVAVIPTTQYSVAGIAATNQTSPNVWIVLRRCYVSGAAPVGIDVDHTNIFVSDNTSSVFQATNFRFGNVTRDFGVFITNGSDSELAAAQGNSAIGWNFVQVTVGVIRDSYSESGDSGATGQLTALTSANDNEITISNNYLNGSNFGLYAVQTTGGNGVFINNNYCLNFTTACVNNSGPVGAGSSFGNVLSGTPAMWSALTNVGLNPDTDQQGLGAASKRWVATFFTAKSSVFTSASANPSTDGAAALQLANADKISWRNAANSGNDSIGEIQTQSAAGCTTSGGASAFTGPCTVTVTWPSAFADANYRASCVGIGIGAGVPLLQGLTGAPIAASVTVQTQQATGVNASFTTIQCTGVHQ